MVCFSSIFCINLLDLFFFFLKIYLPCTATYACNETDRISVFPSFFPPTHILLIWTADWLILLSTLNPTTELITALIFHWRRHYVSQRLLWSVHVAQWPLLSRGGGGLNFPRVEVGCWAEECSRVRELDLYTWALRTDLDFNDALSAIKTSLEPKWHLP